MALSHAILAVLSENTCSGYDLAKQFDGSVGFFWKATHQQIYRELAKLEGKGVIESREIEQTGRPNKKQYSVTESGLAMLCDWIAQPSPVAPTKDELLVKLFVGHLVPLETMLKLMEQQRALHQDALKTYHQIANQYFANPENFSQAEHFQYLTLRNGIHYEQGWLNWCEEAIVSLKSRSE